MQHAYIICQARQKANEVEGHGVEFTKTLEAVRRRAWEYIGI